jgi:O-methyltransferase
MLKKFLFSLGFSLTRITNNSLKPVELNEDENKIIDYVKANNLSMCTTLNLQQTAIACKYIVMNKIPGDFVECGVYKGGNALIAAKIFDLYKSDKKVYLFDTFTGMSEPSKCDVLTDGKLPMLDRYLSVKRENYTNWANASIEEVKENFIKLNLLSDNVIFVKGKVEDTLEEAEIIPKVISFLRLDTDWYESTKKELEKLYEKLVNGGILVIDDYGTFDGAKKAVDEYFKKHSPPPFLSPIDNGARIGVKVGTDTRK